MPEPISLGIGIADTNTVPGLKHRTFYAVEEGGQRVSIDATNREIVIEMDSAPDFFIKQELMATGAARQRVQGASGVLSLISANASEALHDLTGASGQLLLRTALCNGKTLYPHEETWCSADGTQRGKVMVVMSDPYDVVTV